MVGVCTHCHSRTATVIYYDQTADPKQCMFANTMYVCRYDSILMLVLMLILMVRCTSRRKTCLDVEVKVGLMRLQGEFGKENGRQLFLMVQGLDPVPPDYNIWAIVDEIPKSVQNEVAYNVRLGTAAAVEELIEGILEHTAVTRIAVDEIVAGQVCLKLKYRRAGEPVEPGKKGGCGKCDSWTKTVQLSPPSADYRVLAAACIKLYRNEFNSRCVPTDIRGIGVALGKLAKQRVGRVGRDDAAAGSSARSPGSSSGGGFMSGWTTKISPAKEKRGRATGPQEALDVHLHMHLGDERTQRNATLSNPRAPPASPPLAGSAASPSATRKLLPSTVLSPRSASAATLSPQTGFQQPRLTRDDVDPEVYNEMPADIREELARAGLAPPPAKRQKKTSIADFFRR